MPQPRSTYAARGRLVSTSSVRAPETLGPPRRTWDMRYSRAGIVAVLAAAEIFVAGAILWALGGGSFAVHAASLPHAYSWQAGKAFSPIDAGNAPHVVVNDPESRFVIEASTDGKV